MTLVMVVEGIAMMVVARWVLVQLVVQIVHVLSIVFVVLVIELILSQHFFQVF